MKMAKTILLGTAAALVGTVGASAADLRAAPPVQFVQVCDAAGAGFWVIPGTDVCVSINGTVSLGIYVQSGNTAVTANSSFNQFTALRLNPFFGTPGAAGNGVLAPNAAASTILFAAGRLQARSFQRTDIGIIRSTINIQGDTGGVGDTNVGLRQAWMSVTNAAGVFTAGLTETFFAPAAGVGTISGVSNSAASFTSGLGASNGGLLGNEQGARRVAFAYTAVLAPNATATIAIEQNPGLNTQGGAGIAVGNSGAVATGQVLPALVANVMLGTLASGNYVALSGAVTNNRAFDAARGAGTGGIVGTTGWAAAVTAGLNADVISRGSRFGIRFAYSDGASQYLGNGITQSAWVAGANSAGVARGTMRNVAGWAANAAYTHQWNPQWRTALYAGVTMMNWRGGAAFAESNITGGNIFAGIAPTSFLNTGTGAATSNSNTTLVGWNVSNAVRSAWQVGTSTMWTPVSGFSIALDVSVNQARFANTFGGNGSGLGTVRTGWTSVLGLRRDF